MKTTSVYKFNQPEGADNMLTIFNAISSNFSILDSFDSIVEKSIGANGYIKYKSGLKMQWGTGKTGADTARNGLFFSEVVVQYPVPFTSVVFYSGLMQSSTVNGWASRVWAQLAQCTFDLTGADECTNGRTVNWFAIGI